MALVTAILMNYKRPQHLRRIIPALRSQSVEPWIVLVNNAPNPYVAEHEDQCPDEVWELPRNVGPFARFLAAYAYHGWLYFQDDDLLPTDNEFIADLWALARERPNAITGVYGRHIPPEPPHYRHPDTDGPTNFVKTILMMMRRDTLGRVRFPVGDIGRCDDIHVGLETSGGDPIHFSDRSLVKRLKLLPQLGVGQSQEPQHYPEREMYSAVWWREHRCDST